MLPPRSIIDQAIVLGSSTDLTQGAGGNLSCKLKNTLWIKASGTRLKDAEKNEIFIPLNLSRVRKAVIESEDLRSCYEGSFQNSQLRPSIETSIHCLLPQDYVAHVHSVGAIATSVMENAQDLFFDTFPKVKKIFIPYCKPGIQLAKKISQNLNVNKLGSDENLLILLGNHGIIAAAKNAETTTRLILDFENNFITQNLTEQTNYNHDSEYVEFFPKSTLNSDEIEILLNGALTPDQVVFLGPEPFVSEGRLSNNSSALIREDGSVWCKYDLGQDAKEIVSSFVKIAKLIPDSSKVRYLSYANISELLNWEAEKWRKNMQA